MKNAIWNWLFSRLLLCKKHVRSVLQRILDSSLQFFFIIHSTYSAWIVHVLWNFLVLFLCQLHLAKKRKNSFIHIFDCVTLHNTYASLPTVRSSENQLWNAIAVSRSIQRIEIITLSSSPITIPPTTSKMWCFRSNIL